MSIPQSPALTSILAWEPDEKTEAAKPRIDRGRVLLETLAAESCPMDARDAKNLLRQCIDNLAAHVGVTRSHLVRHYITEEWVRSFARNVARVARADHVDREASPPDGGAGPANERG